MLLCFRLDSLALTLGVSSPLGGLPRTILVAFVGAVMLLFLIHLLRRRRV